METPSLDITLPCGGGAVNVRVGAVILRPDGKFLMVGNPGADYLYSVGGRVRFGETAAEAVAREVQEETGVALAVERLGFVHENYFYGDGGALRGKLVYEISFFFYMKTPADFCPVCHSRTEDGRREFLEWVAADDPRTLYPEFFRSELSRPTPGVKHFLTDGRAAPPRSPDKPQ